MKVQVANQYLSKVQISQMFSDCARIRGRIMRQIFLLHYTSLHPPSIYYSKIANMLRSKRMGRLEVGMDFAPDNLVTSASSCLEEILSNIQL